MEHVPGLERVGRPVGEHRHGPRDPQVAVHEHNGGARRDATHERHDRLWRSQAPGSAARAAPAKVLILQVNEAD